MKILIICLGGYSSSAFAQKLEKASRRASTPHKVIAMGPLEAEDKVGEFDILMLSPQVKHEVSKFKNIHQHVIEIPVQIYGMLDGKKALELVNAEKM